MSLRTVPRTEVDEIWSFARPLRTGADLEPLLELVKGRLHPDRTQ